ncbi:MMPL family transporter, partial [Modestobacter versicolor]
MLESLARSCVRSRRLVVALWLVSVVALSVLAGAFAGPTSDDFTLPGSESTRAADLLADAGFEARSGYQAQVVLHRPDGVDDPAVRAAADDLAADITDQVPGAEVVSPFDPAGARQVSPDGTIAYLQVDLPQRTVEELAEVSDTMDALRADVDVPGLDVEIGGLVLDEDAAGGPPAEVIGVIAAALILFVAFGSLLAMALPLVVGVLGALCGVAAIELAAHVIDVPSFAGAAAGMIAIGVGIDYSLLLVTRYREALHDGLPVVDAVVLAQRTAGRSVLFAGVTVVIASLGLVFMGLTLITGVAIGIAAAVLVTMLAAVTLLPALL